MNKQHDLPRHYIVFLHRMAMANMVIFLVHLLQNISLMDHLLDHYYRSKLDDVFQLYNLLQYRMILDMDRDI